ncbi:hypothetical protein [Roseovarius phycicola]|uniref:Type IV pilus biogenesis n=1 Tax=Roseovarius phycicola TaxID=3080976 RepID=A0ABZ2HKP4_9RHOB
MKPNFALTLSFDGIGLLHRAFPGWHSMGDVSLDSSDLAGELAALLDKAHLFDANGVHTKLVLPNDQIRYLQLDAEGLAADEIGDAVARALNGATPYALEDLAYDWSISAGQVYVAAVARDTLNEAEAFAADHGFKPLCFVAIPDSAHFVGEPWFGESKTAAGLLPTDGFVERDTAAIRVIGPARLPEPAPTAMAESEPQPAQAERPEVEVMSDSLDVPDDAKSDLSNSAEVSGAGDDTDIGVAEGVADETPVPVSVLEDPIIPDEDYPSGLLEDATDAETTPVVDTTPEPGPTVEANDAQEAVEEVSEPAGDLDDADTPREAKVAFTSIRATRRDDLGAAPKLTGAVRDIDTPPVPTDPDPAPSERNQPPLSVEPPKPAPDPIPDTPSAPEIAFSHETATRIGASLSPAGEDRLLASIPAAPDPTAEPSFATKRDALIARAAARYTEAKPDARGLEEEDDERQRMTIFGARDPVRIGGKPKFLGVMLTAALLIFLVGVAAWASIYLDDGLSRFLRSEPDTTTVASVPGAESEAIEDLIEEEPEFTLETEDFGTTVAALPGASLDLNETQRGAQPEARPAQLSPDEARARYAVTGVWQRAPDAPVAPESIPLEDFYLTSIDPKVTEQDAVALPEVGALQGDERPGTLLNPPAADTEFVLDGRGNVRATPGGAITPNGVRVFAGQPRLVPGTRPDPPAQLVTDGETVVPLDPEIARLAEIRPKPRPGDLSEQNERENLGGLTRSELASLRPKLRPQSAQELAEQAAAASTAGVVEITPDNASVEAAIAAAVQQPDPFAGATAQAVATSRKPKTRPRNIAQIVQRSQQQAQQAVQTAAVVPSNQRVAPSAPTATTVARAATEQNVLKLRRVNLIGVYGSQSNRRALVRLPSGRYKKVQVGDRLDGGRVSAIGDSEIRYVKSGRNVVLKMPSG